MTAVNLKELLDPASKNGYAIAYKRYSKKYILEEQYAKKNKLGIWQGTFQKPEEWRKKN